MAAGMSFLKVLTGLSPFFLFFLDWILTDPPFFFFFFPLQKQLSFFALDQG